MSAPRRPMDEHTTQVRVRAAALCEWLGISPGHVLELDDTDPDEHGQVEVTWQSTYPEFPVHGKVVGTGAKGSWGEPTIHSGRLYLDPMSAREMLAVVGPKPEFFTREERAQLDAFRL